MLQQLSMIVNDIDHVVSRIQSLLENQIRPKLPPSMADEPVLLNSFQQSLDSIRQDVPAVQQRITDLITKRCVDTLNNVKEISPQYGEGPPREPSHFVAQILEPLAQYIAGSGSILRSESRQEWTLEVIAATTLKYSAILADRLLDMRTREERVNKVKAAGINIKARGGVGATGGIGGLLGRTPTLPNAFSSNNGGVPDAVANMSNDDKIRLQYVLDVLFYKSEVKLHSLVCIELVVFVGRSAYSLFFFFWHFNS